MALPTRARSARLLVVTLVSISLVTITVDYRQGDAGPLASLGNAALTVISPLQEAVSKVTKPVGNFFSTLVRLPSIRNDNRELRARVAELESQVATSTNDAARLAELEALLGLREGLEDVATTGALVIGTGPSNLEWTITIDRGSSDGIALDMPVVAAAGLVGRVTQVSPESSLVLLIIDPDSFVAGRLDVSRTTGLVSGEGERDLRMSIVSSETEVMPGEQVVTSGYKVPGGRSEGIFPPGILIGSVSRVLPAEAELEKFITVRPAVDFSSLEAVLVVLSDGSG